MDESTRVDCTLDDVLRCWLWERDVDEDFTCHRGSRGEDAYRKDVKARVEIKIHGTSTVLFGLFGRQLDGTYGLPRVDTA